MLEAGVGLLRTLPPADERRDADRAAHGAGPRGRRGPTEPPTRIGCAALDGDRPGRGGPAGRWPHAGLRGAGYLALIPASRAPTAHAVRARRRSRRRYAHVTAPLRRLGDRYAIEVCLALFDGGRRPARGGRAAARPARRRWRGRGPRERRRRRAVVDLVEALRAAAARGRQCSTRRSWLSATERSTVVLPRARGAGRASAERAAAGRRRAASAWTAADPVARTRATSGRRDAASPAVPRRTADARSAGDMSSRTRTLTARHASTGPAAGRARRPAVVRPRVDRRGAGDRASRAPAPASPLVPQGGNTGLVGGATPLAGEVVVDLRRLDRPRPGRRRRRAR